MGRSGASREAQADEMSASGILIPQGITSTAEKMTFLSTQRERLRVLLSALDKEASSLSSEESIERDVERRMEPQQESLKQSKSEADFDRIEREDLTGQTGSKGGSWLPWAWGAKPAAEQEAEKRSASGVDTTL